MKVPNCEFEVKVVRGQGCTGEMPEISEHLAQCHSCRASAAIVEDIQTRMAGVEPPSGLADDAPRLWHVSRLSQLVAHRESVRRKILLIRILTAVVPLVIAGLLMRRRLAAAGMVEEAALFVRNLGFANAADTLSMNVAAVIAGTLLLAVAIAVLRLTSSDSSR